MSGFFKPYALDFLLGLALDFGQFDRFGIWNFVRHFMHHAVFNALAALTSLLKQASPISGQRRYIRATYAAALAVQVFAVIDDELPVAIPALVGFCRRRSRA
jgi:hypothetical protein